MALFRSDPLSFFHAIFFLSRVPSFQFSTRQQLHSTCSALQICIYTHSMFIIIAITIVVAIVVEQQEQAGGGGCQ